MTTRNEKLQEKLSNKDQEVKELQEKNESLNQALTALTEEFNPVVSSQKIAELNKNNRHLGTQLMSVKSRYKELETKNQKLEEMLEKKEKLLAEYESEKNPEPSELQTLADNLEKTKKKLCETNNLNLQLKNELKMAHKCLQQEIGSDSINMSQLINSNSNWRGRAQQINMLQSKIAELKEKLESTDSDSFDISNLPVKRLDSVRKMEIDSLTKDLMDCRNELDDMRQKLAALKARNKNLSDEANNYKLKTLELMEKSKHDDDYIKCLNEKISMIKYEYEHKCKETEKEMIKIRQLSDDSKLEVQKVKCDLENILETLSDRETQILNLKMVNEDLENKLRDVSGDFLFSCRDMNKTEFIELMKTLEQEKNNLLKMTEELTNRLNKQSALESEHHDLITKQRIKISRLEAKVKELEGEKEASKAKHRRGIRISEYSRSLSGSNVNARPVTKSNELLSEVDRLKFK